MGHVKDLWTVPGPKGKRVKGPRWGKGQRWLAVWDEHGRDKSKVFPTKDAAEAELAARRANGPTAVRRDVTVADYSLEWLPKQLHYAAQSVTTARQRLAKMVTPHIGALDLATVTHTDVQQMVVAWVEHGYSASSVRQAYSFVTSMFADAQHVGLVDRTPCVKVNLPSKTRKRIYPLTDVQVGEIRDRMPPWFQSMVIVAAATGLRGGELRGLTVDRVIDGDIIVDRQLAGRNGVEPIFDEPKSQAGFRRVGMGRIATEVLEQHLRDWPSESLVWKTRQQGPMDRKRAAETWRAATKGMVVRDRSGWHDLRHFHASVLIRDGHSPKAVAERLGHEDEAEALRTYSHLWPADHQRMAESADKALAGIFRPKVTHLRLA